MRLWRLTVPSGECISLCQWMLVFTSASSCTLSYRDEGRECSCAWQSSLKEGKEVFSYRNNQIGSLSSLQILSQSELAVFPTTPEAFKLPSEDHTKNIVHLTGKYSLVRVKSSSATPFWFSCLHVSVQSSSTWLNPGLSCGSQWIKRQWMQKAVQFRLQRQPEICNCSVLNFWTSMTVH